jgi:acyl transferase domain-containing protein
MTERASPDIEATLSAALKEIRRLRAELKRARLDEPIAVIGAGCRIPGSVRSTADLSRALAAGTDAITDIPSDRWDVERYFDPNPDAVGTCPVRRGGFIEGVELFDPQKFGISAREAEELDPQHRLLLEVAWETLHDSGRSRESVANTKTGVFVGVSMDDYSQRGINSPDPTRITAYSCLGSARSIAAGRVAYTFDFKGPAMQLDTTCSSSLLTIHLGCRSLNSGECDLVLAGGVNVMLTPSVYIGFWNLRALSPDGVCRAFDARANGYVRGEGCSMVLLKRLSDAVRDKDRILALIKASGANHDGRSNGLTAPNGSAQVELIESVLSKSGLSPEQIGYVEAHGTGTELGDPIELESLARALRCEGRSRPLFVGSLKANFGHLEAAAGATSFLKAVMSVKEGRVFPHINCERPNPRVRWSELALSIPTSVEAWPVESGPRTASVNAFGMSGTNVHVVVQQYEPSPSPLPARDAHGLYIHGGDPEEARHCATEVIRLLEGGEGLAGVASSLNALTPRNAVGRFVVARDRTDAVEQLGALARSNDWIERRMAGEAPCRVAFVFPGQGSQRDGMGLDLLTRRRSSGATPRPAMPSCPVCRSRDAATCSRASHTTRVRSSPRRRCLPSNMRWRER